MSQALHRQATIVGNAAHKAGSAARLSSFALKAAAKARSAARQATIVGNAANKAGSAARLSSFALKDAAKGRSAARQPTIVLVFNVSLVLNLIHSAAVREERNAYVV